MTLYKYSSINRFTRNSLLTNTCFFASPKQLNDQTELTRKLTFNKFGEEQFEQQLHSLLPLIGIDAPEHIHGLRDKNTDLRSAFADELTSKIAESVGIFSMSSRHNDHYMFAVYGASHAGICIEYDFSDVIWTDPAGNNLSSENLFNYMECFKVDYVPQLPVIDYNEHANNQQKKLLFSTKLGVWQSEEEYRLVSTAVGLHSYCPKAAMRSVTLGINFNKLQLGLMHEWLSQRGNVALYEATVPKVGSELLGRKLIREY